MSPIENMKKLSPEIKLKIIELSKCFWYWRSFYNFYAQILGTTAQKLESRFPKENFTKYRATEMILESLEEKGEISKIHEILSCFYKLQKPFEEKDNPNYAEAKLLLNEFKQLVGRDVVEEEIEGKEFKKNLEQKIEESSMVKQRRENLEKYKTEFLNYCNIKSQKEKQERGYWLERCFFDILGLENFEHKRPYKTETEQIDGHFKFNKFDYLVELKWVSDPISQEDISIFDGKLSNKGQSTRGVIVSISGFGDSAIKKAETTPPKLIFLDGTEFMMLLENRVSFFDLFTTREDTFVRQGKIYK